MRPINIKLSEEARHERVHIVWLCLDNVQNQAKLIQSVRGQDGGDIWKGGSGEWLQRALRGLLRDCSCFICLSVCYMVWLLCEIH